MRVLSALVAITLTATAAPAAGPLQAGAAVVDVTPPLGYPMWGYGARKAAACVGVLDPLKARALVIAVGSERFALVSLDLGRCPPRASTDAVRARVKKEAGVGQVFLCGSHTHHGPVLEVDDWPSPDKSYVRVLEGKIADAIVEAAKADAARPTRGRREGKAVQPQPAFQAARPSRRP